MSLEFQLNPLAAHAAEVDCVVVGLFADGPLPASAQALDLASGGRLTALRERGDLSGKAGRSQLLHDLDGVVAKRVLVVGLGEAGKFTAPAFFKAVAEATRALKTGPSRHALLTLSELPVVGRDSAWAVRQAVIASDHAAYAYTATKANKNGDEGLKQLTVLGAAAQRSAFERGQAIAQMVIAPVARVAWTEVPALPGSARGTGGFGSTGLKRG